jgi:hypothetical protein
MAIQITLARIPIVRADPLSLTLAMSCGKTSEIFWGLEPKLTELDIPKHIKELLITVARNNLLPIQSKLDLSTTSDNKQLLYLSDAVLHQIHLE